MFKSKKANIILSVIVAVLLWAYVIGVVDPSTTKSVRNLEVSVKETDVLFDRGLAINDPGMMKVNVTLSGKRSDIRSITDSELVAYLDVSECEVGDNSVSVQMKLPRGVSVQEMNISHFDVSADYYSVVPKDLKIVYRNLPSDKQVSNESCAYTQLRVEGRKAQLDKVEYIQVLVDAGAFEESMSTVNGTVTAMDKKGKKVPYVKVLSDKVPVSGQLTDKN